MICQEFLWTEAWKSMTARARIRIREEAAAAVLQ